MPIEIDEEQSGKLLIVRLTGKLVKEDYDEFIPVVDRAVQQYGKVQMLVEMRNFHGWTASALWADTKFGALHYNDIERLAVVGEKKWQKGAAIFCKPFTAAVHYFGHTQADEARAWLQDKLQMAD